MTAPESPSALLRRGADRLDELAGAATKGPWTYSRWHSDTCKADCDDPSCFLLLVGSPHAMVGDADVDRQPEVFAVERSVQERGEDDAAYIAAVDPLAGRDFAAMLRAAAALADVLATFEEVAVVQAAMDAARKILGEAS